MPHDQLFKELIHAFFREFVELFFPQIAARIDFGTVEFLDAEVFTDVPDGSLRRPDVIAKIQTLDGLEEIVLFHIEVQSSRRQEFPRRMFEYYALLRLRFRLPVFPVALYLVPGSGGLTSETYSESVFDQEIVNFRYHVVSLPDLRADEWRDRDNPLAPALASVMQVDKADRIGSKLLSLRRILDSPVDEARKSLLVYVVEKFQTLTMSEQAHFDEQAGQARVMEVQKMMMIYAAWGMQKMLLHVMNKKFGEIPLDIVQRIKAVEDEDGLNALADRVITAKTLQDMQLTEN